ncbi:hypothetical protein SEVIR_5G184700v4 [Setaria viridis]|uniref:Partial AB-hydrolase lipase domain-containing protein n=2 Tax=Setaria TaxID=4554 RepID=K3XEY0_SETIT|nr:uncharacterized protein LOC101773677 [Setaria italica]XP_034595152.1 uncharacterized protein LOC117856836 isoform X1 [Setaria viridis]RCV25664.1 hypothetical protein SETIT_5G183400v2 [Setaria italica]TKW14720.1 hypothetical protein SEVIR_5G184700v2 [Setaria viridis]
MLQEFVDNVIAVTKESVKTFTYESLNNIARFINGISALLLTLLPGKGNILEGISGWELKPALRGPRLPRWMESGVSSFNEFIHELSADSDTESVADSITGDDENEEFVCPPSPLSQSSRLSRASSFGRRDRRLRRHIRYAVSWILWPLRFFISLLLVLFSAIKFRIIRSSSKSAETPHYSRSSPAKRSFHIRDQFLQRTTDRRRGVFEDLHLAIEIFIESVFDIVHKGAHYVLSPSEVWQKLFSWIHGSGHDTSPVVDVPTANVGSDNPVPTERKAVNRHSLNTDSRTCEDVITELGYPFEAIKVVTSDGYVLLLERIPRRDSQKVVLLQHGILDSSMGWVSNGVVGSPAFAAYDQGYDVFLGNLRGLVSREHIDKNISSYKYWKYSVNEHGTKDMPAIIEEIHKIKTSELGKSQPLSGEETEVQNDKIKKLEEQASQGGAEDQPYKLCAVCHSLGGAVMLMYVVTSRITQKPHRLSRLVLLSPAGFHEDSNVVFSMVEKLLLFVGPVLAPLIPGLYIPTRFFRMLLNKLARDFHNYPALGGLVQTLMGYVVGGDSSNWVGVLGLPHYNMDDMPGVSFHVALHLAQIKRAKKFQMYDYGSHAANMEAYGTPEPLDLGAHYGLIDIPVDLVAGQRDRVISPSMVKKHYKLMRKSGVEVSYNEFEYAHLDFTFSHREELLSYVMSRLLLVTDPGKGRIKQSTMRLRKSKKVHSEIEENVECRAKEEADELAGRTA